MDRTWSLTKTRFTVFGGDGAFIPAPSDPEKLTDEELSSGTKLAENVFGRDRKTDNKWVTLAEVDPAQGQRVGDRIIFRLVVDAISRRERQRLQCRPQREGRGERRARPARRCSPIRRRCACRGGAC